MYRISRAISFLFNSNTQWQMYLLCTSQSKTAHPPRAIPGHLTRVKLRTVGSLIPNEARPVGHLTFVSKPLWAVWSKIFQKSQHYFTATMFVTLSQSFSIRSSLNMGDILLQIAREWKTAKTWFSARLLTYQSSIVSQILDFFHWMVNYDF